jgi:hypothetical protein
VRSVGDLHGRRSGAAAESRRALELGVTGRAEVVLKDMTLPSIGGQRISMFASAAAPGLDVPASGLFVCALKSFVGTVLDRRLAGRRRGTSCLSGVEGDGVAMMA